MKNKHADWIVIHMAHSRARAEEIQKRLTEEGFWIQLRPLSGDSEAEEQLVEVLALPSEAREARNALVSLGLYRD